MTAFNFKIEKKIPGKLGRPACAGRAGVIHTPHGDIETPAFVTVGTKATVKALTPEMVNSLGAPFDTAQGRQVVLANTYHLYLQPGDELVKKAGGLHKFMNYDGPMMTDSGGFQVFSLGAAYGEGGVSKFVSQSQQTPEKTLSKSNFDSIQNCGKNKEESLIYRSRTSINNTVDEGVVKLAKIDEDGVTFKSVIDGSEHRFTPERSMQIQHNLGADIIFAFDECTAPLAPYEYQKEAMERTHRWAERSLAEHQKLGGNQALFGIVQGGRHQDLREESARIIDGMDFDGFGIGGSFNKEDMGTAVGWVSAILPEDKPRHLLGIGEPADILEGVKNGADTFDCVTPTRMARNGTLMVHSAPPSQSYGETTRLNIFNAEYREDLRPIEEGCGCYACALHPDGTAKYSRAYLAHLFRAKEILGATLASIHNLYFLINFTKQIRQDILDGKI